MSIRPSAGADNYDATVPLKPNQGYTSGEDRTVPVRAAEPAAKVKPEPVKPEPVKSEPVKPEPVKMDDEKTIGIKLWETPARSEAETAPTPAAAEPEVAPVVGWLVCVKGNNIGRDYRLVAGRNFVGRALEMDVCIKGDNSVSRSSHAIVVYDPRSNVFLAQPGDAKELFYINGELILSPTKLNALDKMSLGETVLMFVPLCCEEFDWSRIGE